LILRELTLQNFRSYGETPTRIELDRGLLLFEGDVGSGKSSILYAIEFALFGLGELDAKSIIRSSANSAKVELEFAVGEKEYKITRTIERKRGTKTTTIQTRGWLLEPDGKVSELSPTELRSRILQILKFKERQSARASSRIYRYAVFTPQELMKEVLSQRPEDRLDTLRRAFGVEDYSFAAANTEILTDYLESQIQVFSKLSDGLQQKERQLEEKKAELLLDQTKLNFQKEKLVGIGDHLEESRSLFNELDIEVKRITQLQMLVPVLEANSSQLRKRLEEEKIDLEKHLQLSREIDMAERQLQTLKEPYKRYLVLREKLREFDNLASDLRNLDHQISKLNESIISKEAGLRAELESKREESLRVATKIKAFQSELLRVKDLGADAQRLRETVEGLSALQSRIENLKTEIGNLQGLVSSKKIRISEAQTKIRGLDGISKESVCPLCGQTLSIDHLKKVETEYATLIVSLEKEESDYSDKIRKLNEQLTDLERQRLDGYKVQRELELLEGRIARADEIGKIVENSRKELVELERELERINATLANRSFAKEFEEALSRALAERDLLSQSLKDQQKLEQEYQELEDSGIAEAYQSSQSVIKNKTMVHDQVARLQTRCQELEDHVRKTMLDLEAKKKELEQGEPLILQHGKIKEEIKRLEDEYTAKKVEVEILHERINQEKEDEEDLSKELDEFRRYAAQAAKCKEIKTWLSENFLPAVGDIERYVLASINEEFGQIFQRIFSILVVEEGELTATVDDQFSPVIEEAGYELDVQSLSGGERTAVALAYRLALNYMVKRANEALQTNLLILDEPTEGFSREQIYRFRNALEELASDQVIIVSHERDLEPMADRVFRIEKVNGESVVTLVSP
jgi:exonuclease SbcC